MEAQVHAQGLLFRERLPFEERSVLMPLLGYCQCVAQLLIGSSLDPNYFSKVLLSTLRNHQLLLLQMCSIWSMIITKKQRKVTPHE